MSATAVTTHLWDRVKADLGTSLPADIFETCFRPVVCRRADAESVTLGAPNDFAAIWINDNYLDLITQKLRHACGRAIKVVIESAGRGEGPAVVPVDKVETTAARPRSAAPRRARLDERGIGLSSLSPRNTFENFVIGPNSQLAHATALAVAQAPSRAYNPLFLYGATGLGKTHLMHAVGHHILHNNPDARVAYLSTEKFTNEFIQAIQENTTTKFRQRYRGVDVLLLDDVQFLSGKERCQEEFFHTFNDLHNAGKQILLTSDCPASEIGRLESRLVSRFQWGMSVDIQPPDFETRFAILRSKAGNLKKELPPEVLQFIARHIVRNIRRLEGALLKVASFAALSPTPIDVPAVERLLSDMFLEDAAQQLTIETIQKRVAEFFQLRPSDMVSRRRPANIASARQVAMYLSRVLTRHSLQEIGEAFGGRDHGTVIHACKTVDNMMEQDAAVRNNVEFLKTQLTR